MQNEIDIIQRLQNDKNCVKSKKTYNNIKWNSPPNYLWKQKKY